MAGIRKRKVIQSSIATINYVTDEDGAVEYTVTIHHRKIDKLDEEEKTHLAEACKGLKGQVDPYMFSIVFL